MVTNKSQYTASRPSHQYQIRRLRVSKLLSGKEVGYANKSLQRTERLHQSIDTKLDYASLKNEHIDDHAGKARRTTETKWHCTSKNFYVPIAAEKLTDTRSKKNLAGRLFLHGQASNGFTVLGVFL